MGKPSIKILVIDDSELIMKRVVDLLTGLDRVGEVHQAGSFLQGMELAISENPDLIFLDINLPDRSGIELLKELKRLVPHITVAMLTNQAGDYYNLLCMRLGADYFLDKSRDFETLPSLILSLK